MSFSCMLCNTRLHVEETIRRKNDVVRIRRCANCDSTYKTMEYLHSFKVIKPQKKEAVWRDIQHFKQYEDYLSGTGKHPEHIN